MIPFPDQKEIKSTYSRIGRFLFDPFNNSFLDLLAGEKL
jgi:hypothetical protein